MAIKIPVSAQFDAADLKQKIQMVNDQVRILASQVGQANKQKFEPINLKSKEDLDMFIKQMQKLLKIQTELKNTMGKSGQGSTNPLMADWKKMYGDQAERIKKMQGMLNFLGVEFSDLPKPKPLPPKPPVNYPTAPQGGGGINWRQGWGGQGVNFMQSGLRAAGPVGGVFSNALGAGLSGGAGAGLMGLVGGLAALGVGKLIGAITQKIEQAQTTEISLDRIYRQAGIASYEAARANTRRLGNAYGMTYSESAQAAAAYTRAGGFRAGMGMETGLMVGTGMARAYGMDPTETAGMFGGMVGSGAVRSNEDIRRLGLLIGEGIGKSGAFGQADQAMKAVTDFMQGAARASHNTPSGRAYMSALSGLLGTNLPGMDVAGSAAMLGQADRAIRGGGAFGQAGQNFFAQMGAGFGLNPYQLKMWQQSGAFTTMSDTFGSGSLYSKYSGHNGPGGSQTLMAATLNRLRRMYGNNPDQMAAATANLFGMSMPDAMVMQSYSDQQLNGVSSRLSRLKIRNVNPGSYAALGQIESGRGLEAMGNQYLNMSSIPQAVRSGLETAMRGSDPEALKNALTKIAAQYGNAETEGSKTRDSIAKVQNVIEDYARKAIPALNIMRMAMVNATGSDEPSIKQQWMNTEGGLRKGRIGRRYENANRELQSQLNMITGNDSDSWAKRNAIIEKQKANNRQRDIEMAAVDAQVLRDAGYGADANGNTGLSVSSPAAAAAERGIAGGLSAGDRNRANNNPGNVKIKRGNQDVWGSYGSMGEGINAAASRWVRYRSGKYKTNKPHNTLRDLVEIYAPASDGNDVDAYTAALAKNMGVDPDRPLQLNKENLAKLVQASLIRENSRNRDIGIELIKSGVSQAYDNPNNYIGNRAPTDHTVTVQLLHPDGRKQEVKTTIQTQHVPGMPFKGRPTNAAH